MGDNSKSWEQIIAASKGAQKEAIKTLAEGLALVHALKQGAPSSSSGPDGSELFFELSQLHMKNVEQLAKISSEQTEKITSILKARRAAARREGDGPVRVLVSLVSSNPTGEFTIRNESEKDRMFALPDVVHMHRLDKKAPGVFVGATFQGGAQPSQPSCPLAFEVTVPKQARKKVTVSLTEDPRFEPGRYRGKVPLEADGVPPAVLVIELLVKQNGAP